MSSLSKTNSKARLTPRGEDTRLLRRSKIIYMNKLEDYYHIVTARHRLVPLSKYLCGCPTIFRLQKSVNTVPMGHYSSSVCKIIKTLGHECLARNSLSLWFIWFDVCNRLIALDATSKFYQVLVWDGRPTIPKSMLVRVQIFSCGDLKIILVIHAGLIR